MGVDLNRIGFGISSGVSRNGFGSIVSFLSVDFPAAGTVLSVTDTSRYENDYSSQPFWMPYTLTVYANGTGGSYQTEVWGLQYLPAGWRTGVGYMDFNVYVAELAGNFKAGEDFFYYIEDGTGINYSGASAGVESRYAAGTLIGNINNYDYLWDGLGSYYSNYIPPPYPPYGQYESGSSGNVYFTTPSCGDYVVGTFSYTNYHDGNGGTYSEGGESYLPYGTSLGTCGDYTYYSNNSNEPKAYWHYYNGYILGYTTIQSYTNGWAYSNAPGGLYLSSESRVNVIADGQGNSYASQTYTWYPTYGTLLDSSSYTYQYMDENGDTQTATQNFEVLADGLGSYYINNT